MRIAVHRTTTVRRGLVVGAALAVLTTEVEVVDTRTGTLTRIPVGKEPHGLCLFPQPGLISLGHTGNYR